MPVHVHGERATSTRCSHSARKRTSRCSRTPRKRTAQNYRGKRVGALGASGGFSLQCSKNLTAGEGGFFVTNDREAAELANRVRNFSHDVRLDDAFDSARPLDGSRALQSQAMGSMYRGNELAAAFGRAQLSRLPALTAARCRRTAEARAQARRAPGRAPAARAPWPHDRAPQVSCAPRHEAGRRSTSRRASSATR